MHNPKNVMNILFFLVACLDFPLSQDTSVQSK